MITKQEAEDLCREEIGPFIGDAYRLALDRGPDTGGMAVYLERYAEGYRKEDILYWLITSEEAKGKGKEIDPEWLDSTKKELAGSGKKARFLGGNKEVLAKHREEVLHDLISEISRQSGEIARQEEAINALTTAAKNDRERMLRELSNLKAEVAALKARGAVAAGEGTEVPKEVPNEDDYGSIDYFDFENHFRGDRERIKEVQKVYLPYFEGKKKVLDLGCGRGEFTELLMENGVDVTGVDMYGPYVEYMKMMDLPVIQGDAIRYLETQENVGGIFLGQVVEHLTIGQIIKICETAYQKLEEGCFLIMETPNPMCLSIYTHAFYMDPSHQKPVHPLTLKYLAEKAGFTDVEILFTETSRMPFTIPAVKEEDSDFTEFNRVMHQVSEELFGSQDYAVIAKR